MAEGCSTIRRMDSLPEYRTDNFRMVGNTEVILPNDDPRHYDIDFRESRFSGNLSEPAQGKIPKTRALRELQSPLPDFPVIREQPECAEVIYRCLLSPYPCRHRH